MSLFVAGDRVKVRGNSPATKMRGQTGVVRAVLSVGLRNVLYELRLDSGTRYDAWEEEVEAAPSKKENKVNIKKEDGIKIDPETGLPELPEGHRWRVTDQEPFYADGSRPPIRRGLYVILERQIEAKVSDAQDNPKWRWWNLEPRTHEVFYSEKRWKITLHSTSDQVSAESVLLEAKSLFGTFDRQRKADAAREGLIGVYPPKKLEVEA